MRDIHKFRPFCSNIPAGILVFIAIFSSNIKLDQFCNSCIYIKNMFSIKYTVLSQSWCCARDTMDIRELNQLTNLQFAVEIIESQAS